MLHGATICPTILQPALHTSPVAEMELFMQLVRSQLAAVPEAHGADELRVILFAALLPHEQAPPLLALAFAGRSSAVSIREHM